MWSMKNLSIKSMSSGVVAEPEAEEHNKKKCESSSRIIGNGTTATTGSNPYLNESVAIQM